MIMTYFFRKSTTDSEPAAQPGLWHRFRPRSEAEASFSFWAAVFVLGVISLFGVTWTASAVLAKKGSEKLLRVDLLLPKLNSGQGERKASAFRMSDPAPTESTQPKDRKTSAQAPAVIEPPIYDVGEVVHEPPPANPEPP